MGLRIVTLDSFYDSRHDKLAQELIAKMAELKIDGYLSQYPYGDLPVDATDFIGHHSLVCQEWGSSLVPVLAYRSVTASRCHVHKLEFPMIRIARDDLKNQAFAAEIERLVKSARTRGVELSFDSSYTMSPRIRHDEALIARLRELMLAMHVHYHLDAKVPEVIAGGVLRFKMERYYQFWGYEPLKVNGSPLPPVEMPFMFGEKVQMFFLRQFSDQALRHAEKYRGMWESRLSIGAPQELKKAA